MTAHRRAAYGATRGGIWGLEMAELFVFSAPFWIVMGAIVAMIAHSKGQASAAWFFYGLLIWPIALVHILIKPADRAVTDERAVQAGIATRCPHCAEMIKLQARVCKHCGREVTGVTPFPAPLAGMAARPNGKPGDEYWGRLERRD